MKSIRKSLVSVTYATTPRGPQLTAGSVITREPPPSQLNRTTDLEEQKNLIIEIETILWQDLATIPVFAFPGIVAYDATATGVEYNATQSGLTWNMQDWGLS